MLLPVKHGSYSQAIYDGVQKKTTYQVLSIIFAISTATGGVAQIIYLIIDHKAAKAEKLEFAWYQAIAPICALLTCIFYGVAYEHNIAVRQLIETEEREDLVKTIFGINKFNYENDQVLYDNNLKALTTLMLFRSLINKFKLLPICLALSIAYRTLLLV